MSVSAVQDQSSQWPNVIGSPDIPQSEPATGPTTPTPDYSFNFSSKLDQLLKDPSFKLDYVHANKRQQQDLDDHAKAELLSTSQLPGILGKLKETQEHNAMMNSKIQEFNQGLSQPVPMHQQPQQTLAQSLGEGLVALLGGQVGGVLGAGQQLAGQEETRRFTNAANQYDANRENLTTQRAAAQQELSRGQARENQLQDMAVEQQNLETKEKSSEQARQDNLRLEEERVQVEKTNAERQAANTDRLAKAGERTAIQQSYSDYQKNLAMIGELTPEEAKRADAFVDQLNIQADSEGLPHVPYFPVGATEKKRHDLALEGQKSLDRAQALTIAKQRFKYMSDREHDQVAKWSSDRDIAWARFKETQDHHRATEEISRINKSELGRADTAYKKARDAVKGLQGELSGAKTKVERDKVQARIGAAQARADELKAYLDDVAGHTTQDEQELGFGSNTNGTAAAGGSAGIVKDISDGQALLKSRPDLADQIKARFKQAHGIDLPGG